MCKFTSTFYDDIAVKNSYRDLDLVQALTLADVEKFLRSLGVSDIDVQEDYLVCPTICHNPLDEAESMKLYYYNENKSFHCYTQCSENFNIIELYRRYMELNHQPIIYDDAIEYLRHFLSVDTLEENDFEAEYDWGQEKILEPIIQNSIIYLPPVNKNTMDVFTPMPHPLWIGEGISAEVQKKFNIRFSYEKNQIIIPHYDIRGELIGIRSRMLDEEDLEYGKYRPTRIGIKQQYNHQLGFNLYGIWEHKKAIQLTKRAIIYEGEKSCMLDDMYYGPYSVAVATCGSQLNKFQINLLVKELGVSEIILAYDKEYDNCFDEKGKEYRQKLIEKCEKYRGLATFYYLFDEHNLLNKKDAPCDKGKDILEELMKRRIKIK